MNRKQYVKKYYLDLFSGIGGFALGAFWAGIRFDDHYFSEVDKYAVAVYQKRFPEAKPLGNIKTINGEKLPRGRWVISGGFPCQDISISGKGIGLEGNRSGLWYEYERLISEIRPEFAIIENVGAITFRGLDRVLASLAKIGYDAEWQDIRASDLEAPHRRERIWILAYPHGFGLKGCNAVYSDNKTCKIGDTDRIHYAPGRDRDYITEFVGQDIPGERIGINEPKFINTWKNNKFQRIKKWWNIEPDVGRLADGVSNGVDRLKCLGNAIVPEIAEIIWLMIKYYFDMDKQ
jgi:DNA (cytosine-5)-methyltransferase 1